MRCPKGNFADPGRRVKGSIDDPVQSKGQYFSSIGNFSPVQRAILLILTKGQYFSSIALVARAFSMRLSHALLSLAQSLAIARRRSKAQHAKARTIGYYNTDSNGRTTINNKSQGIDVTRSWQCPLQKGCPEHLTECRVLTQNFVFNVCAKNECLVRPSRGGHWRPKIPRPYVASSTGSTLHAMRSKSSQVPSALTNSVLR